MSIFKFLVINIKKVLTVPQYLVRTSTSVDRWHRCWRRFTGHVRNLWWRMHQKQSSSFTTNWSTSTRTSWPAAFACTAYGLSHSRVCTHAEGKMMSESGNLRWRFLEMVETASGLSMRIATGNRHRTVHINHESLVARFILQEEIKVWRYQYQEVTISHIVTWNKKKMYLLSEDIFSK